jgi:hypothetical protein
VRFHLSKLILAVTMLGLAFAGMAMRTSWLAESIVTLTLLLLVAVAISAVLQTGRARGTRLAFAIMGGAYLLIVTCTVFASLRDSLLTSRLLIVASRALRVPTQQVADEPNQFGQTQVLHSLGFGYGVTPAILPTPGSFDLQIPVVAFVLIGHCLWSWFFAFLAGGIASWIYAKRENVQTCVRLRYSTRDLLWLTLVVAMGLGWWMDRRPQKQHISVYYVQWTDPEKDAKLLQDIYSDRHDVQFDWDQESVTISTPSETLKDALVNLLRDIDSKPSPPSQ